MTRLAELPTRTPAPNRAFKPSPSVACPGLRTVGHLGRGGMADVWMVEDVRTGRPYALKILHVADPKLQRRLLGEGRIQERLQHPNVARVVKTTRLRNGSPALLMEFVGGPRLDEVTCDYSLNTAQADDLARQILSAMAEAHRLGIVHRDLKPENILLKLEDEAVVAKIIDFGLAKATHEDPNGITVSGMVFGTPTHMAPEQFRNTKDVDARADVFALGTILYELLTGRPTFERGDFIEVFCKARDSDYIPLVALRPDLPQRMIDAVERALQPNPEHRFANAHELLIAWSGVAPTPQAPWSTRHIADLEHLAPVTTETTRLFGTGRFVPLPPTRHPQEPTLVVHPAPETAPTSFGNQAFARAANALAGGLVSLADRILSLVPTTAVAPRRGVLDDAA